MAVRIGHASIDENGFAKNGTAGDQTGKEVCIRSWYNHTKGWIVLRCKDASKREKIAQAMEKACANPDIGYDQYQRDTLFNNIKDKGFDPSKTTKKVETDCSALVRVCIAYAYGADKAGNIRTVSEPSMLVKTGLFEKLTDAKYCASSDYLLRGDILCTSTSGHTVVVLDNGAKIKASTSTTTTTTTAKKAAEAAYCKDEAISGEYKVASCSWLSVRNGAGTKENRFGKDKSVMVAIPAGCKVKCYSYYTPVNGTKWLYVQFTYNGVTYTGFASSKHLVKV